MIFSHATHPKSRIAAGLLAAALFHPGAALAYEVDDYTGRSSPVADAGPALDAETNRLLDAAIARVNREGTCSSASQRSPLLPPIYEAVRDALDSNPVAEIERFALESSSVPRVAPAENHIYNGGGFSDGVVLWAAGLEPSVRIGGHFLGADKLGHFMAQGFEYFEQVYERGSTISQVLSYGEDLENGRYGLATTGVKSYGDLSANFSGMSFWRDLLYGDNPIVVCENGRYRKARAFSWSSYVNHSWDEAINCSEFNAGTRRTVEGNLRRLGVSCPVARDRCLELSRLPCASHFLGPACFSSSEPQAACPTQLPGLPPRSTSSGSTGQTSPSTSDPCPPEPGMWETVEQWGSQAGEWLENLW